MLRQHNAKATIVTTPCSELTGAQLLEMIEQEDDMAEELMKEAREHMHEHHHHHDHDDDCDCGCGHHHHDEDEEHEHHHHEHSAGAHSVKRVTRCRMSAVHTARQKWSSASANSRRRGLRSRV